MKLLFMGTPDFALFSLRALVSSRHSVIGVVTQPDKPRGRGYELMPSPIKVYALEKNIPVYQPSTLRGEEFAALLDKLSPDAIIVAAYGKLLPKNVLEQPRFGCINIHGSLLPEYRGAAPMQRAIIDGKKKTGITTMYMAEGLDTGDILLTSEVTIGENDNFEVIHDRLGECGAELILKTLDGIESGAVQRTPQNGELATYAAKITKDDCRLSFEHDARTLHNLIRGLSPVPLAFTHTPDGKLLKVISARVYDENVTHTILGEVLSLDGTVRVACRRGSIELLRVIPEGKSRMDADAFIRGRKINVGDVLN